MAKKKVTKKSAEAAAKKVLSKKKKNKFKQDDLVIITKNHTYDNHTVSPGYLCVVHYGPEGFYVKDNFEDYVIKDITEDDFKKIAKSASKKNYLHIHKLQFYIYGNNIYFGGLRSTMKFAENLKKMYELLVANKNKFDGLSFYMETMTFGVQFLVKKDKVTLNFDLFKLSEEEFKSIIKKFKI